MPTPGFPFSRSDGDGQLSTVTWPAGQSSAVLLVRNHDWANSLLGPSASWSEALKSAVDLVLGCSFPMIVLWGPELVQIYNDAYSEVMATKHPGGIGQRNRDCWPEVWYINQPIFERVFAGEVLTFEEQIYPILRRGFREEVCFNICYSPLRDQQMNIAGILVTLVDVSRPSLEKDRAGLVLKQQWQTFDTVLSHTQDLVYIFDLQGRFTYANRALLSVWGVNLHDALGKTVFELGYPPEVALKLQSQIQQVIDSKQTLLSETPYTGAAQVERYYEYTFVPVLGDDGNVDMVIGSAHDVTEYREGEAAIQASLVERETLLKEIHHRVKNNLQVIESLLGLQSDHITDPAALAAFRDTKGRVRAIARIHETLYSSPNLAEVEFGHYARVLVGEIVQFFDVAPGRIRVLVETEEMVLNIEQAIPLGLILNELTTNALKHAFLNGRSGTIEVTLSYLRDRIGLDGKLDDALASLQVKDDGPGVPTDVDLAATASMGLYLVRVLTRQLHGTLELAKSAGACFRLTFPITQFNEPGTENNGQASIAG